MRKFLYFLKDADDNSLTVEDGEVVAVAGDVPLPNTPDGWQDKAIAWERDMKTVGINRSFSLPLGFVLDGSYILRDAFYSFGIERRIYIEIRKLHTVVDTVAQTFQHQYLPYYRGELDLSTFTDEDQKVTASISEGTVKKLFDANRATMYEFPLSEGDRSVEMDGINLEQKHSFLITEFNQRNYHFVNLAFLNKEGEGAGVATFGQSGREVPFGYDYVAGEDYFLTVSQDIDGIRIHGSVKARLAVVDEFTVFLYRTSTGTNIPLATVSSPAFNSTHTLNFDITVDAIAGEKFYLTANAYPVGGGSFNYAFYQESNYAVDIKSRYRTTTIKAYTPFRLFQLLVEAITGDEANAESTVLNDLEDYVLTSGDGLRALEGAKIKTSLNEFFEAFHAVFAVGMGIEGGKVVIEEKTHFLNTADPIILGPVKDCKISPSKDLLFNTVKIGYNPINTDDVNGRFAFNNTHIYKTELTRIAKELTLVSPYAADPFAIELVRINLEGKTTTDNSSDNQVFFLNVSGTVENQSYQAQTVSPYTAGSSNENINFDTFDGPYISPSTADVLEVGEDVGAMNITASVVLTAADNGPVTVILKKNGTGITSFIGNANGSTLNLAFATTGVTGDQFSIQFVYTGATDVQVTSASIVFAFNDLPNSYHILNRPAAVITGVPDPDSIFNVLLSPKRMLLRHLPWINSCLPEGTTLTFQTTEKNDALIVDGIEEKANVTVGSERLFQAVDFSFDTDVPVNMTEVLEATPNKSFTIVWKGVTLGGFTLRAGIAPATEKEQSFKLLSAPDNDLKNLIR